MKRKALFVAALVGLGSFANAQTTQVTNEAGTVVTPEANDWAIGFNAAPVFDYVGNMFNGSTGNSLSTQFVNTNNAIYGKMFVDENTAYRASVRLMYGSGSSVMLQDTNTVDAAPDYIENKVTQSGAGIVLGAGIEKRRGHNRLQGYYGGEALITLGGTSPNMKYEYALEMDTANLNAGLVTNGRTLSSKSGSTFGIGVRGFIGAEYFILPKISIAAEYGWGLSWSTTGAGETVTENYGFETASDAVAGTASVFEVTTMTGKSSSFNIDTDNWGGAIRLMFHF
ncbi:hypothetical protein [Parvicella tangerina]|uniref:Outer membrane protein beta-barrel domain-containing protein n=1 Tax=Parvicella tangerina TaxID=2829795 RepID=A0A916NG86_9FLAO|nr:hypothetical protein [Parvicella tangerina]CAG5080118.1 hypothetical protein CRYO30217_01189 [Parvicella tangerina]